MKNLFMGVLMIIALIVIYSSIAYASPPPGCTIDPDTGQCWIDTDNDGVQDSSDNCKTTYNPGQEDNDHDRLRGKQGDESPRRNCC